MKKYIYCEKNNKETTHLVKEHAVRSIGRILGAAILCIVFVCLNWLQPQQVQAQGNGYYGKLQVQDGRLTDMSGNPVQLKGVSTHGMNWFPEYVNEENVKWLHEKMGMNVLRLAMYTAEYNGYCAGGNQEELKGLIRRGVQYATDNQMYVIIDWHILSDNNPNWHIEEAKQFFNEMSAQYAGYDNVFYEICNEPNGGTSWEEIRSYAYEVIPVIRANDADGIILVGTPNWSQFVNQAAANPITGYDNIMYTLHFYAATHTDWLRNTLENAVNDGLPVFVTEYGICDASGNGGIDYYQAEQWKALLDRYQISSCMWNMSNKAETSSMFVNWCNKTSDFTEEDLSEAGHWLLKYTAGSDTLLSAKEGLYPDESGNWFLFRNGNIATDYTGISENDFGQWYVVNGQVDFGYTGVVYAQDAWRVVIGGRLTDDYTGLAANEFGWWYLENGQVNFNYTGIVGNEYGWWKVDGGKVNFEYTGLASNEYGWWYLSGGQVNFNYTGIVGNEYGWWKVDGGKVNFDYTGLACDEYGWWYLKNGCVDFTYTGKATNEYGTWKVVLGAVVF